MSRDYTIKAEIRCKFTEKNVTKILEQVKKNNFYYEQYDYDHYGYILPNFERKKIELQEALDNILYAKHKELSDGILISSKENQVHYGLTFKPMTEDILRISILSLNFDRKKYINQRIEYNVDFEYYTQILLNFLCDFEILELKAWSE